MSYLVINGINNFAPSELGLEVIGDLIALLIDVIFIQFLQTFFEVLIFDFMFSIFDNIFGSNAWGFESPLAFGLFMILILTASGVLWYRVK